MGIEFFKLLYQIDDYCYMKERERERERERNKERNKTIFKNNSNKETNLIFLL